MSDPREVPPRCHQRLEPIDRLMRVTWICTFLEGHTGMHSGKLMSHDSGQIRDDGEVIRWGTPAELDAEIEATRSGDWREALARAWDAGALHERSGRGEENPYRDAH